VPGRKRKPSVNLYTFDEIENTCFFEKELRTYPIWKNNPLEKAREDQRTYSSHHIDYS
jgi:hypothetical protein